VTAALTLHRPAPTFAGAPISLAMRLALGQLHTGALYLDRYGNWRSREQPSSPVLDKTVRSLERRGLALLQEYEGLQRDRRICAVVTPAGRRAYQGGVLAHRTPPPVRSEAILFEIEAALIALDRESRELTDKLDGFSSQQFAAQKQLGEIETRLARLERARQSLDARRIDLRALVGHAADRLAETFAEARD
jgi:DNA-binding MarR family transcriptional regulator